MGLELAVGLLFPGFYNLNTPQSTAEDAIDIAYLIVGLVYFCLLVTTAVFFCMWVYRVSINARALGSQGMKYSTGFTVASFFIPIVNLILPYIAVKEIERASSPRHGSTDWPHASCSGQVGLWWLLCIGTDVINMVATFMAMELDPAAAHASSWVSALASAVSIAAAYNAIRVMKLINAPQAEKVRVQPQAVQSTCVGCGYDIRGTPGTTCPECGAPILGREAYEEGLQAPDPRGM